MKLFNCKLQSAEYLTFLPVIDNPFKMLCFSSGIVKFITKVNFSNSNTT